jgi:4,5-DOPA dioxygenase extradiol
MTERLPAVFVSHGAPTMPIEASAARDFLTGYGKTLGAPKAILVISAHWDSATARVSANSGPETIHDFYGFPQELYRLDYPAPGSPALASRTKELLNAADIPCELDATQGLDHGAWVPLLLMYPEAKIPVVQLSVQTLLGPAHHLKLGQALRPLRDEGVLILGSGGVTHNLSEFRRHRADAASPTWVTDFQEWIAATLEAGKAEDVVSYRQLAPHAAQNHPSEEHFFPLIVAAGAGSAGKPAKRVHRSNAFAILAMDAYRFD